MVYAGLRRLRDSKEVWYRGKMTGGGGAQGEEWLKAELL